MPYRVSLLLTISLIIPLGYFVRFSPLFPNWFSDVFGSIAYQIFFISLVQFCFPKTPIAKTVIGVFIFACAIEFLQLWQPPFLQAIRATPPGRLILGNTFLWSDFPSYAIGSTVGWLGMRQLKRASYG
ncbi:DUF2809 domain-containing protein [Leptolyngbya sp. FACHB-17]|uniref:ribosomal maturation YjgA family protein n=1 Tax=unclassified Leptolyngbya TaxID=2650499 RepID=UPI001680A8C1|nr:DUF2809 domain-containing protein [Leptolyngbya sp. FACHB-17]MBD2079451.1 DUF2809 domain-containing protein [Leptolyngbya sp. FACHB-17]